MSNTFIEKKPALLLIDIQKGFENVAFWGGGRNNVDAEEKAAKLLDKWRHLNLPIFHVRHSSENPESHLHKNCIGFAFHELVQPLPAETIITKTVNSAFIGTPLKELLDKEHIDTVVVLGITTNHCVSTTARMASNLGYDTYVIEDATATFDLVGIDGHKYSADLIHKTALANLNGEFATIWSTEELLALME